MKIILAGKISKSRKLWWVGKQSTCIGCKCAVELELGDNVAMLRDTDGVLHAGIRCPTVNCGSIIWFFR